MTMQIRQIIKWPPFNKPFDLSEKLVGKLDGLVAIIRKHKTDDGPSC